MLSPCLFNQDFAERSKSVCHPLTEGIGLLVSNDTMSFYPSILVTINRTLGKSFHRITERFVSERSLKITWFQSPCHSQGHLSADQVAQSPIQPDLEHFQG